MRGSAMVHQVGTSLGRGADPLRPDERPGTVTVVWGESPDATRPSPRQNGATTVPAADDATCTGLTARSGELARDSAETGTRACPSMHQAPRSHERILSRCTTSTGGRWKSHQRRSGGRNERMIGRPSWAMPSSLCASSACSTGSEPLPRRPCLPPRCEVLPSTCGRRRRSAWSRRQQLIDEGRQVGPALRTVLHDFVRCHPPVGLRPANTDRLGSVQRGPSSLPSTPGCAHAGRGRR
jgi:hypothetical protein